MYPIGEKCLKLDGKRNYKILFEIFFHRDFFFDLLGFFCNSAIFIKHASNDNGWPNLLE